MNSENIVQIRYPELQLLLCCARTNINAEIEDQIIYIINEGIDWKYLMKLACFHELIPILYYNINSICPEKIPNKILRVLKNRYNKNVQHNLLLTGELIKILNLLKSHNIVAIPYKGPVLTLMVYKNLSLRYFNDLDIIIDKSEALKAANVLISNGYKLHSHINNNEEAISLYLKTQREFKFINEKLGIVIEIQWDLNNPISLPVKSNYFLKKGTLDIIEINNNKINVFSPENHFIILCIHAAAHDWEFLMWICDIYEIINSNRLNWQLIIEKAERFRIKRIILITLSLVKSLYNVKLPDLITDQINLDKHVINISKDIEKNYTNLKYTSFSNIIQKGFFDLNKRESKILGIKDFTNNMLKPSIKDFEDLSLPIKLYPVYYFMRPFLILKRYGKDSI